MQHGALMEAEIRSQPAVLSSNASRYEQELRDVLKGREFDMVLLAARGSSDHAALYARYLIETGLGIPAVLAAPSVWTRYGKHVRYPRCLAIGISQSGAAPDVAEVLTALRADGHFTLGITNTAGSPLTRVAEASLLLETGEERSVAATKTFTASLLALYSLTRALGAELPDPERMLPDDSWVQGTRSAAESRLIDLLRCPVLFALGRGFSFATANEAALKLMECALLPCRAYSSADFEHGPRALAGPGSAVLCFGNAPEGLEKQGALAVSLPSAAVSEELRPLWDVIGAQWLALLASRARGLNADRPEGLSKVTKTL